MNLSKPFGSGLDKVMRKAAHPSGGMDSSNLCHQRRGGSTTMVVVFVVCLCCVLHLVWLLSLFVCKKVQEDNPKVGLRV